eukprot:CAMPEP_0170173600 /NCGR_PEP_ID=MMETSP0040_2-20121228/6883_1 /TAXON_ID=641309 /ORGANISM="Lotharella oceanica, Strain CCMP622" /LENGTH=308 /DNA_ID=CAMNT_0010414855 /DNA_START=198 /DNA_END=1124 /DNA_ORIENTATION=+
MRRKKNGHTALICCAQFAKKTSMIVTGSADKTLKTWDLETGKVLMTFEGHTEWVSSVCFGIDDTVLYSGSWDATIRMWNANTGEILHTLWGHSEPIRSVAYMPPINEIKMKLIDSNIDPKDKGGYIVSASDDKTVKIWDPVEEKQIVSLPGDEGFLSCVVEQNPEMGLPRIAVSTDNGRIYFFDSQHGLGHYRHQLRNTHDHKDNSMIRKIAYHWDSKKEIHKLASISDDGTLRVSQVWENPLMKSARKKGEKKSIKENKTNDYQIIQTEMPNYNCSFSHDGKYLAVVTNTDRNTLQLYTDSVEMEDV